MNVLMFGMEHAGKTHLLYTGLVGNGTLASLDGGSIQPTAGFNCEDVTGNRCSFTVWDIGGHSQNREFWTNYVNNISTSVIIYVVNANECIERLRESKQLLHNLMAEQVIEDVTLLVVFNTTLKAKNHMDVWQDQPFKLAQLQKVFKLDKIKQFQKAFEFDVTDQEQCTIMFDFVSLMLKSYTIKTQMQKKNEAKETSAKV